VTGRLQRQALRLAILPFIQVTPPPCFMMPPPECLPVSRPRHNIDSHPHLFSFENAKENRSQSSLPRPNDVFPKHLRESPVPSSQSLVPQKNFLFRLRREFNKKGK